MKKISEDTCLRRYFCHLLCHVVVGDKNILLATKARTTQKKKKGLGIGISHFGLSWFTKYSFKFKPRGLEGR